jgi:hypothetical protein
LRGAWKDCSFGSEELFAERRREVEQEERELAGIFGKKGNML